MHLGICWEQSHELGLFSPFLRHPLCRRVQLFGPGDVLALRHSYKQHRLKYLPGSLQAGVAFLLERGLVGVA